LFTIYALRTHRRTDDRQTHPAINAYSHSRREPKSGHCHITIASVNNRMLTFCRACFRLAILTLVELLTRFVGKRRIVSGYYIIFMMHRKFFDLYCKLPFGKVRN